MAIEAITDQIIPPGAGLVPAVMEIGTTKVTTPALATTSPNHACGGNSSFNTSTASSATITGAAPRMEGKTTDRSPQLMPRIIENW